MAAEEKEEVVEDPVMGVALLLHHPIREKMMMMSRLPDNRLCGGDMMEGGRKKCG